MRQKRFASVVRLLAAFALAVPLSGAAGKNPQPLGNPPAASKRPVTDTYFGVAVRDDYRWLEKWGDPEVQRWSDAQNSYARSVLSRTPAVGAIRSRVRELESYPSAEYFGLLFRGGLLFAVKFEPPKQQPFLVVMKSPDDPASERVVVDPNVIDPKGTTTIDLYVPSNDGKLVAVSLSEGGSEIGMAYVYETATGRRLPDAVGRVYGGTAVGDMAWNADGSGFYYSRYPRAGERPQEDLDFYTQIYFHKLGTPSNEDVYSLGRDFPRIAEIFLETPPDGGSLLASIANGDGGEWAHYLRGPKGTWNQISTFADKIVQARFGPDGAVYLLSRQGAPRGKVIRIPPETASLDRATTVVPVSEAVIESFRVTATRVYVLDNVGGPNQVRIFDMAGQPRGAVPVLPVSAVYQIVPLTGDEILFSNQSFVEPPAWYRAGPDGKVAATVLRKKSLADFKDAEVLREFAPSKDGTRVPLTILRRKGTRRDGNNPAILNGYGGYNVTIRPWFSERHRVWIEQGGIYAVANLRGGGEFGEEWHLAGNLARKQNVFDDFEACARHLLEAGHTSREKLAIEGGSNGGLLMGAALTQHPELFRAVVSYVGIYDMLRVELSPNGAFNVPEFGTVKDPVLFRAMHAYSPYHRVANGRRYPAVLFVTGANDPRVDPMHSRKMTARLQAATSSKRPVLLRTSATTGHSSGGLDESIAEKADVFAFLFEQLGVTYKPPAHSAP